MTMGQKGEADVLLVHSPAAEEKFVAEGYGINRRLIMHNDFIVLGPPDDSAKIKGTKSATGSFKKIASAKALFLSRGDNSGTHAKEKSVWKAAGINPEGEKWYQQTGLGMGQTLNTVEAMIQGAAAATKASVWLNKKMPDIKQTVVTVDQYKCRGCGTCASICQSGAIALVEKNSGVFTAEVDEGLCQGCGMCTASCPSGALSQYGYSDDAITASLKAVLS